MLWLVVRIVVIYFLYTWIAVWLLTDKFNVFDIDCFRKDYDITKTREWREVKEKTRCSCWICDLFG